MKQLDIEELRASITDAVREVQQGEIIQIVSEGDVVAMLVPPMPTEAERRAALASLDALRAEIAKHTSGPVDVTQVLSEMRSRLD